MTLNNLFNFKQPQNLIIPIALIFGLIFLFIAPPFQAEAEYQHFYRSFQIADGGIIAQKKTTDCYGHQFKTYLPSTLCVGGKLPKSLVTTAKQTSQLQLEYHPERKQTFANILAQFNIPLENNNRVFIRFPNSAVYSPISYLPQAIGIGVGKLFNFPPVMLLYMGRMVNLIVWVCLVHLAIKIIPIGQWWLFLFALTPMSLFQAASLSADAITNGLSFLLIALFCRLALDKNQNISQNNIGVLILVSVLLSLSKLGSYFSLLLLFLLIPSHKFANRQKYWGSFATILIINVAVVALWYSLVKHLNVPLNLKNGNVSTSEQLIYIFNHPWQYLLIIGKTFIVYGREYLEQFMGRLGWIDTRLPLPHLITYGLLLVAVALGTNQPEIRLSWPQKSLLLLILIINSLFIATMLYLSWMPVGSQIIEGIQGRYFIPLGPLLFLLLYNQKTQLNLKIPPQILAGYSLFSCTLTAVVLLNRYYL